LENMSESFLEYVKGDPDLDLLRGDPRYQAMIEAIELRLTTQAG